jgi:hypothetical protein
MWLSFVALSSGNFDRVESWGEEEGGKEWIEAP